MDKPIYALSGYAEWFYLMARGWKDVENRDWPLSRFFKFHELPVRVYLHASKTKASKEEIEFIRSLLNEDQLPEFDSVDWNYYRGKLIGKVTFTHYTVFGAPGSQLLASPRSPWAFGKYCFWAKDGLLYTDPIPCKGKLGFFKPEFQEVR
jgi:hypothetical protein